MTPTEPGSREPLVRPPGLLRPPLPGSPLDAAVGDLQVLTSRAGRCLIQTGRPAQAAHDLANAWERLGAAAIGKTIRDRLASGQPDPQLDMLFGQPWQILELAALALAVGETVSAVDLCADAALLGCGEPLQGSGRFYDLGDLRRRRRRGLAAAPAVRAWIDQLLADPVLPELEECRHHLAHRTPPRHVGHRQNDRMLSLRQLAEITTLHGVQPARWHGSIADLVPRLVAFGEDQLRALCTAILTRSERR